MISSQVSRTTAEGGGNVAPDFRHRSSHTRRAAARTTNGGTTRDAMLPITVPRRSASGRFGVLSGSTRAVATGDAVRALSNFVISMAMSTALLFRRANALRGHSLSASDLDALDREALQVSGRVVRIEHLAVEERLPAARRRGRDLIGRDAEILCRLAPEILAVHLADERLGVQRRLELAPPRVFGEEPEIMALERIGGVIAPVLHDVG